MLLVCAMASMLAALAATPASSPLTEVELAPAYADVDLASTVLADGLIGALRSDMRFDKKIALVNAFPPGREGTAEKLVAALAAERREPPEALRLENVSAEDRALIAYLRAREDEADLSPIRFGASGVLGLDPLGLAGSAARANPDDFAIAAVEVMIATADPVTGAGCDGWSAWDKVLHKFPEACRNMRAEAVLAITESIRARCPAARTMVSGGSAPRNAAGDPAP